MLERFGGVIWRELVLSCKVIGSIVLAAGLISGCELKSEDSANSSGVSVTDGPVVAVSWQANSAYVDGYTVYYGSTADTVDRRYGDFSISSGQINPDNPQVQLSAYYDLGLRDGEQVCLSVQAYNSLGASGLSTPVCTVIN